MQAHQGDNMKYFPSVWGWSGQCQGTQKPVFPQCLGMAGTGHASAVCAGQYFPSAWGLSVLHLIDGGGVLVFPQCLGMVGS